MARKYEINELREMNFKRLHGGLSSAEYLRKKQTTVAANERFKNEVETPDLGSSTIGKTSLRDDSRENQISRFEQYVTDRKKEQSPVLSKSPVSPQTEAWRNTEVSSIIKTPTFSEQKEVKELKPEYVKTNINEIKSRIKASENPMSEYMTPKQLETYSYYLEKMPKAAEEYAKLIEPETKTARANEEYEAFKNSANENKFWGGLVGNSAASVLAGVPAVIGQGLNAAKNFVTKENTPLPTYSDWYALTRMAEASREGVLEDLNPVESKVADFSMNLATNALRLPLAAAGAMGQVASLVSSSSSAAGQTMYDATQRGASQAQTLLLGAVSGTLEAAFEKLGIDRWLGLKDNTVRLISREAATNLGKHMLSEGAEEFGTEIGNIIADTFIMADKSNVIQKYNSYLQQGYDTKTASIKTGVDLVGQALGAGLGGALSGGVLGGGGMVVGSLQNNYGAAGAAKETGLENLIAEGQSYGEDTNAHKLANKAAEKTAKGKTLNSYQMGQLYNENRIAGEEELKRVQSAVDKVKQEETEQSDEDIPTETLETPTETAEAPTEKKDSANSFSFETAEQVKPEPKTIHEYNVSAEERYNALGEKGKKGFDTLSENMGEDEDIEAFARDFERAYVLGHSGFTEQQVKENFGENYFENRTRFTAFYNGQNDSQNEVKAIQKNAKFEGVPLAGNAKGLVENDLSAKLSKKNASLWDRVGKQLNTKIELVEEIDGNKYVEGKYKDGVIRIKVSPDSSPIPSLMAHEVTHRIKETAPEMFEAFKTEVASALGKDFQTEFNSVAERYRITGEKTDAEIEEELVSEYAERLFKDETVFEQIANRNLTLAERIITAVKEFVGKIKAAFGKGTSAEIQKLDSIQEAWAKAYDAAVKTARTAKGSSNSAEKYAIKYTDKNVPYVEVESETIQKYEGYGIKALEKALKSELSNKFGNGKGYYIANKKIAINADSKKEFTNSKYSKGLKSNNQGKKTLKDKYLALFSPDEVLEATRAWVNEDLHHERKDNIVDFARGDVNIKVGDRLYSADTVVGYTSGGNMIFYDLVKLNEAETFNNTNQKTRKMNVNVSASANSISDNVVRNESENDQKGKQNGKYALRKDIAEMNEAELREELSTSRATNESLQKFIKEGAIIPSTDDLMSFSVEMLDKYGSNYDKAKLARHLYNRMYELGTGLNVNGESVSEEDIEQNMQRTAKMVLEKATEIDNSQYMEYAPLRKSLRETEIRVSQTDALDFGSKEDFAQFRKTNFGRLPKMKVVNDNSGNVDETYQMLNEAYPEFFPADVTAPSDQLRIMAGIFDVLAPVEKNVYDDIESAANDFINDIYDFQVKFRHGEKSTVFETMKEKKELEWRKQREYQNKQAQNLFSEVRQAGEREVKERLKEIADDVKRSREIRKRNAMERAILSAVKWLNRNKKIVGAQEALDKINAEVGEIIKPLVGDIPKGKNVVETLQGFLDKYLEEHQDTPFASGVAEYVENKNRTVNKLESEPYETLEEILELVQMARHDVKVAHEQFLKDRDGNYFEIAKKVIDEVANATGIKNKDGLKAELGKLQMSPYTFFRFISGYAEDSALQSLFSEMLEAENTALLLARDGFEQFASVVGMSKKDKELRKKRKAFDKKIITVSLGGKEVNMTAAHIVSLYLHTKNPQNRLALENGIKIPEIKEYLKGRKRVSFSDGVFVKPTVAEIERAFNALDDYSKSWADVYRKFADVWAKDHLNAASEKALGIKVATVENYMPIKRDPNFLNASFESLLRSETGGIKIQNSGALKDRKENVDKPMLLESITDVIQAHIRLVSEYSGKIEALTKADKIFNAKLENGETFNNVLDTNFGQFGIDYLNKFMGDFNGRNSRNKTTFEKLAQGFRGNFAKYVLGANITTRFVQMTSALNGAAEFGWANYINSLKPRKNKLKLEDIRKYTARATARESGYITTELADKMSSVRLFDQAEKISNFFMEGIAKNDKVAIQSILNQAQTYVETKFPDLKFGSEEYFQEVVKAFNRAVNLTQQGNTIALRPEIFRTDNEFLRLFSMFTSESVKNGNLMLDGALNLRAKAAAYKKNSSAKNKEALKKAKQEYANKVTAVIASNVASVLLTSVLKVVFKGQWDKYFEKDEDGELTPKGEAAWNLVGDFAESIASSAVFGKYMYGIAEVTPQVIGKTVDFFKDEDPDKTFSLYDFTQSLEQVLDSGLPEIETLTDHVTAALNLYSGAVEYFAVMSDKNGTDALKALEKYAISWGAVLGIPLQNLRTLILGTAESVSRGIESFVNTGEGLSARYDILKWRYNIYTSAHRQYFYDLLYEAYKVDRSGAYLDIRQDMQEHGISSKTIDSALKKRIAEDQGK